MIKAMVKILRIIIAITFLVIYHKTIQETAMIKVVVKIHGIIEVKIIIIHKIIVMQLF